MTSTTSPHRSGFTLVELMAVMVVLGLLASVTVWSVRSQVATARNQLAVDQLTLADRQLRDHARRVARPVDLIVDLDTGRLYRAPAGTTSPAQWAPLEDSLPLDSLLVNGQKFTSRQVAVRFRGDGTSPSYAIRLKAVATGQSKANEGEWIVFVGRTGQRVIVTEERSLENLL